MHASERPPSAPTKFDANVAAFRPTHGSESAKHLHLPTCAVASAFRKSGSCKCSDRARNCSPWYPSLCSRSFTFHQRYRYRYPPFSAASLIACWTLFMGQSYKCQLLWDRRSAGNGTSGHCQVSSSSLLKNPRQNESSLIQFFYHESVEARMRGAFTDQGQLFSYISPEARVRTDH